MKVQTELEFELSTTFKPQQVIECTNEIKSPMTGLINAIHVKPGDSVEKGQALLVMEAMKMENILRAEKDCIIKDIRCKAGNIVTADSVLLEIE